MREYYPIIIIVVSVLIFCSAFILAYALMKDKKKAIGFERNMKDGEIIKKLLSYAKPHAGSFVVVFFIMLLSIGYYVMSPIIVGRIETLITEDFPLKKLFILVAVYVLALLISQACVYCQSIILQKTGQKIISQIRLDTFEHIESLSHNQLHNIPVGKLVTRVTNDTNHVSFMFTNIIINLTKNAFIIIGVVAAMLCVNFQLAIMVLCFVPFIVIFTLIFRKFCRRAYREVKDGHTDINTFLSENLSGMKIIHIFNRENRKMEEFNEKNEKLAKSLSKEIYVYSVFRPIIFMLYIASILCLLYLSGRGYIKDTSFLGQKIDSGTLVTFYMYISTFFEPIQNLAEMFNQLQSSLASAEKIFTILEIVPEIKDEEGARDAGVVKGDIEFSHVWFAYKDDHYVIKDLSFKINAGETAAFVGATGAGKTTILNLLCRNYDIQKGEILLDGINIKKFTLSSLRRQFGQMLQDVFLFSGTIKSNIALRNEAYSDEDVWNACCYVNANVFINKLKNGLNEEVRERGSNFSTGERQLISFARTVLEKPRIMILDEATANIDTETEILIQDSLNKMKNIGTMLIVAHRLSTIRSSDKIIVMHKGEKVEEGNHEELMKKGGRYYNLYTLQTKLDELK